MAQENIGLADIPEELMSNILIRLPSKFVVRCKLVCKQWASLISDLSFVSSYISRFPSSPLSSWTIVGERVKDRCIEYDLPRRICSGQDFDTLYLSIDHERKAHRRFRVLGANYGTILFGLIDRYTGKSYKSCNLYYICNPAIRKLISLSPPSPGKVLTVEWIWGSGLVTRIENDVLESFRVVLLSPDTENKCLRFMVYASETREWNRYIPLPILPRHMVHKLPTAFNQILHWLTTSGYIIAYDPYAKPDGVRVIWRPKEMASRRSPNLDFDWLCDASKGKLRYLERFVC